MRTTSLTRLVLFGILSATTAVQAIQRSLRKGGLRNPDEIRVDLGIALLRNHQPDLAQAAFDRVSSKSGWTRLAKLWSLRLEGQSSGIKS